MSEALGQILSAPIVQTALVGLAAVGVSLWLAAAWWAHRDATRRSDSELAPWVAAAWVLLSGPLLLPFSVAVYALVRPHEASGDRRTRRLVEALELGVYGGPACAGCGAAVDEGWVRCPACTVWLVQACERCDRPAPLDAQICPWCAAEMGPAAGSPVDGTRAEGPLAEPRIVDEPGFVEDPLRSDEPVPVGGTVAAAIATAVFGPEFGRRPIDSARSRRRRQGRAPGQDRPREDETVAWAGGPVEA